MAYRSAPLYEDVIWRTHLQPQDPTLAQAVRATIAKHREHLLEFIRLDEPAPLNAMTLAQWSSPNVLSFSAGGLFRSYLSQPTDDDPREQTADLTMGTMVYRPDGATINAGATDAGKGIRCVAGTFPC